MPTLTRRLTNALAHELRLAAVALQFLTRVPVRLANFKPQWLHDSARHFPLIGVAVGAWGALLLALALLTWPPWVAVLLSMAGTVWLTGGFHEDGLADTCDGLGGAVSRERALLIMKDSRLGSYGALGLGLTLALKAALLVALVGDKPGPSAALAGAALLLAHGLSRGAAVALLAALPYAGDVEHAKAKPMAQQISAGGLVVALGWCAALVLGVGVGAGVSVASVVACATVTACSGSPADLAALSPPRLAGAVLCAALVTLVCGRWLHHRLGGYTGDGLGATQQWAELAVYLALTAGRG